MSCLYKFTSLHLCHRLNACQGAVIVEYVVLLVVCVAIANGIAYAVQIGTDINSSGFVIKTWMGVLKTIAEDM